jgi:hypothetical protein
MDFVHNKDHYEQLVREIFRPNRSAVEYYNPLIERGESRP